MTLLVFAPAGTHTHYTHNSGTESTATRLGKTQTPRTPRTVINDRQTASSSSSTAPSQSANNSHTAANVTKLCVAACYIYTLEPACTTNAFAAAVCPRDLHTTRGIKCHHPLRHSDEAARRRRPSSLAHPGPKKQLCAADNEDDGVTSSPSSFVDDVFWVIALGVGAYRRRRLRRRLGQRNYTDIRACKSLQSTRIQTDTLA